MKIQATNKIENGNSRLIPDSRERQAVGRMSGAQFLWVEAGGCCVGAMVYSRMCQACPIGSGEPGSSEKKGCCPGILLMG